MPAVEGRGSSIVPKMADSGWTCLRHTDIFTGFISVLEIESHHGSENNVKNTQWNKTQTLKK